MTAWLCVIGIGADGLASLSSTAAQRLAAAEVVVGGERHLALLGHHPAERWTWASPLSQTIEAIASQRGRPVAVLATGDPLWFGIGVTFSRRFVGEVEQFPVAGAFSLAAAALGWPLAETACLTAHGRPLGLVLRALAPGARVLLLANDGATPGALAALLTARGWGASRLTALEHLGARDQARFEGTARGWPHARTRDLVTIAIEAIPDPGTEAFSRVPGLPDHAFDHDGMLTKQAVRAATLAVLAPQPGELLWDVGAGNGSVAIEWLRAVPHTRAIAIERDGERMARLARNADALGCPDLVRVAGAAPEALTGLPAPNAVFIGGGLSTPGVWEACWAALKPGGRLVANAVTLEGEAVITRHARLPGAELTRIAPARAVAVGPHLGWKPAMPVTQIRVVKP